MIRASPPELRPDLRAFGWATLAVVVAIAISHVADRFLPLANLSLIFLMAVLLVAIRFGLWPSVYTSLLSFVAYNFFFTEPHHTFIVTRRGRRADRRLLPGGRGHRRQPGGAAQGPGRGDAPDQPAHRQSLRLQPQDRGRRFARRRPVGGRASRRVDACSATPSCCCRGDGDRLEIASGYPPEDQMSPTAWGAAHWAWEHDQAAGWGSGTLPASEWLFLPLKTGRGPLGLLGVSFENPKRQLTPEQRHLLEALVDQVAVAIERTNLATDIEEARLLTETERLRSALLSSVSHDLRTPLVSIIGSATGLASCDGALSSADRAQLVQTILEESERLEPLRPEPARHDPARLRRAAAEPRMGRSARDRRPGAQADGAVARLPEGRSADPGGRADPLRRPDSHRAGAGQHSRQRRQILAGRWSDRDRSGAGRRASEREGKRRGPRHPARSARHRVRRVLSRARRRQAGGRDGPRPVDLPRPDRGPWRPDRGAARARRTWHDDRLLASGASAARDRRWRRRGRARAGRRRRRGHDRGRASPASW